MTIIKKRVGDNKKAWNRKIKYALWADRITKKSSTGKSPFELVYGLDVTLPIHLKLLVYQRLQNFSSDQDAIQNKVNQLIELDENRRTSLDQSIKNSDKIKRTFDKSTKPGSFQVGDTVYYGTNGGKNRENMESLIAYGWDLISLTKQQALILSI